jgi:hypothetical protein
MYLKSQLYLKKRTGNSIQNEFDYIKEYNNILCMVKKQIFKELCFEKTMGVNLIIQ